MTYAKETLKKAKQWEQLAKENDLSMFEMYELVYHIQQIDKLLNKRQSERVGG